MSIDQWDTIEPGFRIIGSCDGVLGSWDILAVVHMEGRRYIAGIGKYKMPFIWSRGWVESHCDTIQRLDGTEFRVIKSRTDEC